MRRCSSLRLPSLHRPRSSCGAGGSGSGSARLRSPCLHHDRGGVPTGAESIRTGIGLDVRQQGQALLSVFWTVAGLVCLWLGLRREVRELRLAGFALLILAAGKVFLYDLSELESVWRVLSFIVLGLLFLLAALAYQRMRREPVG